MNRRVASSVWREKAKKKKEEMEEKMEDFSMTYSAEADEVDNEDQRRKCDIS